MRVGVLQIQNNIHDFQPKRVENNPFSSQKTELGNTEKVNETFREILDEKIYKDNSISFSERASKIFHEINGNLTMEQMNRLESGLGRLKDKGVSSGILLMDSTAFVLNVKNQTVMATMGKNQVQENVFSNFDAFAVV